MIDLKNGKNKKMAKIEKHTSEKSLPMRSGTSLSSPLSTLLPINSEYQSDQNMK